MALGRLHIVVGIADDIVVTHIGGTIGALGVLPPSVPDGLAVFSDKNALMDIEGPAVIACQPVHI
jgi:hypothetical protein